MRLEFLISLPNVSRHAGRSGKYSRNHKHGKHLLGGEPIAVETNDPASVAAFNKLLRTELPAALVAYKTVPVVELLPAPKPVAPAPSSAPVETPVVERTEGNGAGKGKRKPPVETAG